MLTPEQAQPGRAVVYVPRGGGRREDGTFIRRTGDDMAFVRYSWGVAATNLADLEPVAGDL